MYNLITAQPSQYLYVFVVAVTNNTPVRTKWNSEYIKWNTVPGETTSKLEQRALGIGNL